MVDEFDEDKWQARSDAQTLAEAKVINGDNSRLGRAQVAAVDMAAEKQEDAESMARVAKDRNAHPNRPELFRR